MTLQLSPPLRQLHLLLNRVTDPIWIPQLPIQNQRDCFEVGAATAAEIRLLLVRRCAFGTIHNLSLPLSENILDTPHCPTIYSLILKMIFKIVQIDSAGINNE